MSMERLILLLLLTCSATYTFVSSAAASRNSEVIFEKDVNAPGVGSVHNVKEGDSNCRYGRNTNTLPDGSQNIVVDDIESGTGVILSSVSSDTCLVRPIDKEEQDEARTCQNGMVVRGKDKPDHVEKHYRKNDTELSSQEIAKLPAIIQSQCAGKKVYRLIPISNHTRSDGDEAPARMKRQTDVCVDLYDVYECYTYCQDGACVRRCYFIATVPYYYYC